MGYSWRSFRRPRGWTGSVNRGVIDTEHRGNVVSVALFDEEVVRVFVCDGVEGSVVVHVAFARYVGHTICRTEC